MRLSLRVPSGKGKDKPQATYNTFINYLISRHCAQAHRLLGSYATHTTHIPIVVLDTKLSMAEGLAQITLILNPPAKFQAWRRH